MILLQFFSWSASCSCASLCFAVTSKMASFLPGKKASPVVEFPELLRASGRQLSYTEALS